MKVGEAADVLERAAGVLETDGHCKYVDRDEEGRYCAIGAVYAALASMGGTPRAKDAKLASALVTDLLGLVGSRLYGDNSWGALVWWNDADERTADEVIEAFRMTAKDLRNTRNADEELLPIF